MLRIAILLTRFVSVLCFILYSSRFSSYTYFLVSSYHLLLCPTISLSASRCGLRTVRGILVEVWTRRIIDGWIQCLFVRWRTATIRARLMVRINGVLCIYVWRVRPTADDDRSAFRLSAHWSLQVCTGQSAALGTRLGVRKLLGSLSSSELSSHQMAIRGRPGVQEMLGTVISSELSSHQMAIRSRRGVQKVLRTLIPSELSSHQMAIHSHLGVCPTRLSALHFGVFWPTG